MHPIFAKTFGGLSTAYYVRNFLFGLLFPVFLVLMLKAGSKPHEIPLGVVFVLALNTLLYPYARFVYESVASFILGNNVFAVSGLLFLGVKVFTMAMCWGAAVFIAPLGLAYLYFHHSRQAA